MRERLARAEDDDRAGALAAFSATYALTKSAVLATMREMPPAPPRRRVAK
jgi:hypothetical protein